MPAGVESMAWPEPGHRPVHITQVFQKAAKLLEEHLAAKGLKVDYRWSRREAFLTRIPARLVKKFVLREKGRSDGAHYVEIKERRGKMAGNPLVRWAWINATLADYLALLHVRVFSPARGADVLICDRYLQDAVADLHGLGR